MYKTRSAPVRGRGGSAGIAADGLVAMRSLGVPCCPSRPRCRCRPCPSLRHARLLQALQRQRPVFNQFALRRFHGVPGGWVHGQACGCAWAAGGQECMAGISGRKGRGQTTAHAKCTHAIVTSKPLGTHDGACRRRPAFPHTLYNGPAAISTCDGEREDQSRRDVIAARWGAAGFQHPGFQQSGFSIRAAGTAAGWWAVAGPQWL